MEDLGGSKARSGNRTCVSPDSRLRGSTSVASASECSRSDQETVQGATPEQWVNLGRSTQSTKVRLKEMQFDVPEENNV